MEQEITPFERYAGVKQDMQILAQQLLIFGTHVHVGIEDREFLIDAMNVARYFVPHVLCLSASSPFWMGRNTGLASYRSIIFRHFPRSGLPPQLASWGELSNLVETLVKTNCIPDGTKLWRDFSPSRHASCAAMFPTVRRLILSSRTMESKGGSSATSSMPTSLISFSSSCHSG